VTSAPNLRDARRLLIVKLSSMGDLVHALPVAAALKDAWPHLEISWAAHPAFLPIVEHSPVVHEVLPVHRARGLDRAELASLVSGWRNVRRRGFDVALDLQGLSKSALVVLASGSRHRVAWHGLREIAPLVSRRVPRRPDSVHVVEQLLDVARFLGAEPRPVRFPIATSPDDELEADRALAGVGLQHDARYLVLNPTMGGGGRKGVASLVLAEALNALAPALGLPVILVGGPADREGATAVAASARLADVRSLVGMTSLGTLKALIRRASGHLGGDTGSSHVAAAFDVPTVSWFGRTDPHRSAPYGSRGVVVHHRDRCAAPCLARRARPDAPHHCVLGEPACLTLITPGEIAAAAIHAFAPGRAEVGRPEGVA
jgi:ADP-heptose:LPS heptosyltransferase